MMTAVRPRRAGRLWTARVFLGIGVLICGVGLMCALAVPIDAFDLRDFDHSPVCGAGTAPSVDCRQWVTATILNAPPGDAQSQAVELRLNSDAQIVNLTLNSGNSGWLAARYGTAVQVEYWEGQDVAIIWPGRAGGPDVVADTDDAPAADFGGAADVSQLMLGFGLIPVLISAAALTRWRRERSGRGPRGPVRQLVRRTVLISASLWAVMAIGVGAANIMAETAYNLIPIGVFTLAEIVFAGVLIGRRLRAARVATPPEPDQWSRAAIEDEPGWRGGWAASASNFRTGVRQANQPSVKPEPQDAVPPGFRPRKRR